ncbi:MAG: aldo/keto reductase [Planctomycetes bacterium]|nr:aldo/keto reductase [Planctomycetota bacterium]
MSGEPLSRRNFIYTAAGITGLAALSGCRSVEAVPRRPLGRTGVSVPLLGMGTATAGMHVKVGEAAALFDLAIDLGINYLDTAPDFAGYGKAQMAVGKVMKKRREQVFLVTKCWEPEGEAARKLLESNLRELETDHADLVYAHSVGDDKMDPKIVMGKGGVLEMLEKAKQEGLTRFIGLSGHSRPERFVEILKNFQVDVVMCAVNFADRHTYGFETRVFPLAVEKGAAIAAMKIFGGMGGATPRSHLPASYHDLAFRYALGIPNLSLAVIGMKDPKELEQNLERLRRFKPLAPEESRQLDEAGKTLAAKWGPHFGPVT